MASLPEYNCRVINGPTDLKKVLISFFWMESDKQPKQQHQYNQTQININIVQFDMKITSLFFLNAIWNWRGNVLQLSSFVNLIKCFFILLLYYKWKNYHQYLFYYLLVWNFQLLWIIWNLK